MIKTKLTWTVKQIQQMHTEKNTLAFDHPIQRKSEMWSDAMKGLLIHSMLASYPIPNVYVLRDDSKTVDEKGKPVFNFSVLDGKQRLTNVLNFLEGGYPLSESLPDVMIDGEQFSIAGKYFKDLDEPVRYEILRFKFDIFSFEDATDGEVEEIFFRLNNSVPLTKAQVAKAKIGTDMAGMLNELLNSKFVAECCNFSNSQRKASDDQKCLFQAMMLLDRKYLGYQVVDFSETSIMEYAENLKGNYDSKQQNILRCASDYLTDAFPTLNKNIRKITVPMLFYLADFAQENNIKPMFFRQWFEFFINEDVLQDVYKTYCSTGSTKLEKVNGRLDTMMKSFCLYNEIQEKGTELEEDAVKEEAEKESTNQDEVAIKKFLISNEEMTEVMEQIIEEEKIREVVEVENQEEQPLLKEEENETTEQDFDESIQQDDSNSSEDKDIVL